jgi:hypothetical protein
VHPCPAMEESLRIVLDPETHRRARRRAAGSGLSLSDYVAGLVRTDLEAWTPDEAPAVVLVTADDPPEAVVSPPDRQGSHIGEAVAARMNKPPEGDS